MPKLYKEKKLSGTAFRKRRAQKENEGKQMSGDLNKYLTSHKIKKRDTPASEPSSKVGDDPVHMDIDEQSSTSDASYRQPITTQEAANMGDAKERQEQGDDEQPATSAASYRQPLTTQEAANLGDAKERQEQGDHEQPSRPAASYRQPITTQEASNMGDAKERQEQGDDEQPSTSAASYRKPITTQEAANLGDAKERQEQGDDEQPATSTASYRQPITTQEAANLGDAKERQDQGDDEQSSALSTSNVHPLHLEKTTDAEGSSDEEREEQSSTLEALDMSDPAVWPDVLTILLRDAIVREGPAKQSTHYNFPKDASNRCFTKANYKRRLPNGEETDRNWLVYSVKLDKVFCFCCKLFATKITTNLAREGCSDWKNLSQNLCTHEVSNAHLVAVRDWHGLSRRLGAGKTIHAAYQRALSTETQHWQNVVKRLIGIVKYLGRQCLAFRGSRDTLYSENNGNYLQLVEMLATFDTVMQEHLKRIKNKDFFQHYLGKSIQNELIRLIAKEIRRHIVRALKKAKYYSIILDCTPDIALIEHMTIIVRFVSITEGESATAEPKVCVEERFLGFVQSSTGEGLTEAVLTELEKLKIPLGDMRGQGYDHGSNRKGKHQGLQKGILDKNSRAFYVPCSAHALNLVMNDAAMSCRDAATYFSVVQKIYEFLSGSTVRWNVLKKHIGRLTVKPSSDTRWSSRIDALRPFRFQVGEIYDALIEISRDGSHTAMAQSDAESLAKELNNFPFLCFIVLWYNILNRVNFVSRLLQSKALCLQNAIDVLESTTTFLKDFRSDKGFEDLMEEAKELALEMEIDPVFAPLERPIKKKRMFCYEAPDDAIDDPAKKFKAECFYTILDVCINPLDERLEQIKHHSRHFQFLYDIQKLKDVPQETLRKYCEGLQNLLTDKNSGDSDLDGAQLCKELTILAPILKPEMTTSQILSYASKNGFAPNVSIALRILLTLPISVASGSCSKLRLIQNYLRSSLSQERLVGLEMISIENRVAQDIDFNTLLQDFVSTKARRVKEELQDTCEIYP